MSKKTEQAVVKLFVKCVGCGHRREAKLIEFSPSDVPICERCFMPMVTERASVAHAKSKKGRK